MIILHHLRIGRSVFTAWLLEEMGLDYALEIYERDAMARAPQALKTPHPLGKSPVIEDDGMTIAESGAIAAWLVRKYDTQNRFGPLADDDAAWIAWTQWLHYPEGSAFAPLLLKLLLSREEKPHPKLISAFADGEVALHLGYMEDFLGDKPFWLGARFAAPDIGMTYITNLAHRLGVLEGYPKLQAYRERNMARPAFVRAVERTGG